jgi:hypothetical protein
MPFFGMLDHRQPGLHGFGPAIFRVALVACRSRNISTASYGRGPAIRVRY